MLDPDDVQQAGQAVRVGSDVTVGEGVGLLRLGHGVASGLGGRDDTSSPSVTAHGDSRGVELRAVPGA
ncbi:hypothetical protein GCM10027047_19520 [Rhodococcus aerolatus]